MSNTYTSNAKLAKPAANDTGWNVALNGDFDAIDALSPVGALCVTLKEIPSASLNVAVAAGSFVDQAGAVQAFAGNPAFAVAASSTKVLYLDGAASWALASAAAYPTTPHVRLATVVAGATSITSIADNRLAAQHSGQRFPQVTHLLSTATAAPTIAAGAGAGTGPTVGVNANSSDLSGLITVTTGTTPAAGALATVTFNAAYSATPRAVALTPANAASIGLAYVGGLTTTGFTVSAGPAPAASTAYQWYYTVTG